MTLVPWRKGKLLVWGAKCPDTFTPSYIALSSKEAGAVAAAAETRKAAKYLDLLSLHEFTPVTIETTGVLGSQDMMLMKKLI